MREEIVKRGKGYLITVGEPMTVVSFLSRGYMCSIYIYPFLAEWMKLQALLGVCADMIHHLLGSRSPTG